VSPIDFDVFERPQVDQHHFIVFFEFLKAWGQLRPNRRWCGPSTTPGRGPDESVRPLAAASTSAPSRGVPSCSDVFVPAKLRLHAESHRDAGPGKIGVDENQFDAPLGQATRPSAEQQRGVAPPPRQQPAIARVFLSSHGLPRSGRRPADRTRRLPWPSVAGRLSAR